MPKITRTLFPLLVTLALLPGCDFSLAGKKSSRQAPKQPRTVVVGLVQVGNLDPPRSVEEGSHTVLRTACDPLISLDPFTPEPRPALAMRWSMDAEARVLTLKLRPRVTYRDGSKVDASSIRENLSRVVRPSTSSPWSDLLSAVTGYSDVVSGSTAHLPGVEVVDASTLRIRLDRPVSDLPGLLSHPGLIPVSPASVSAEPPALPLCAGPYKMEAGAQEGDLRLIKATDSRSRNESYARSGRGFVDTIVVRSFESADLAFEAFRSGDVDVSPVPEQRVPEALVMDRDHTQQPIAETSYLGFDLAGIPDPRVRKAISLSIDRLVIIDAAFGDQRQPALRWIPDLFGSRVESRCAEFVRKIADPAQAKALLTAASVDPAMKLSLAFDSSRTSRLVSQAIQVQVKDAIGIDLVPMPLEPEAFEASLKQRGQPVVWMLTTTVDVPTLDQVLNGTFGAGSPGNRIGFDDPEVSALLRSASSAVDLDERFNRYSEVEDRVCDLMPASPLWNAARHWMFRRGTVDFEDRTKIDLVGAPVLRHVAGA